jgi:hypothetical protein
MNSSSLKTKKSSTATLLLFIGEFETFELPQDLPTLQELYAKAK